MAGITLSQAESQLATYIAAEAAVLAGQSYTIGDRQVTRADLGRIQEGIKTWNGRVVQLSRGGVRVSGITPG